MDNIKSNGLKMFEDNEIEKVSGGAIWKPSCPNCKKEMPGGVGVIRISTEGAEHPYFCTECAEELLNSGKATIDKGFENLYEKYEKSTDLDTGEIEYGWKKV